MANCSIILGKTGTGKSTSLKSLNPKETLIMNVLGKRLPFKGSVKMYNPEDKNMFRVETYSDIITLLDQINRNAPHVKNIIIDDAIYTMRKEYFARAKESGYGKYTDLAAHFQQIISTCEALRDDLNVFLILHSEDVYSDSSIVGYKVSTIGSLLDKAYNPLEVVPLVLYSAIKYDDKGNATFGFYTKACKEGTVEIPAKSPAGMFNESFIPNDLGIVVEQLNAYYNE